MTAFRSGTDLILGVVKEVNKVPTFFPLGYSTGCKISDSTETGERVTKEAADTNWKEKYVKTLSETITADGFVYDSVAASKISFPDLKTAWITKEEVTLRYKYRDETVLYEGNFVITSLEQDGPAGDDEKWSVTFENTGAIVASKPAEQAVQPAS